MENDTTTIEKILIGAMILTIIFFIVLIFLELKSPKTGVIITETPTETPKEEDEPDFLIVPSLPKAGFPPRDY